MVAMVISFILSVLLNGNFARDAKVVVIDLDNTKYSQNLIAKIDASEYMEVTAVLNQAISPESLFYRDRAVAVVYLPRNLEKNRYTGVQDPVGVFYDNTNSAQTADIKAALNELIAIDNAAYGQAAGSGLTLNQRILFNPAGSTSNGMTLGFLFFFGAMFFVFATIGMIPRLRLTHQLDQILLEGTPWDLIWRLIPYVGCSVTSMMLGMAVLRVWGDLVFSGQVVIFLAVQLFMITTIGMLSLLFGWNAPNPGIASSRMILFIPGGFILGGTTGPVNHLAEWVQTISHVFPLTWQFHFVRDIILRGAGFADIAKEFGAFLLYMSAVTIFFCYRFAQSRREMIAATKKTEIRQQKLHNLSVAGR